MTKIVDLNIFSSFIVNPNASRNCKIDDLTNSILIIYSQIWFPGLYYVANLNSGIPKDLAIFIFSKTFWLMLILLLLYSHLLFILSSNFLQNLHNEPSWLQSKKSTC